MGSKDGFFAAVRSSNPMSRHVGRFYKGKRITSTYNKSEPNDIWGRSWIQLDYSEEILASEVDPRYLTGEFIPVDEGGADDEQ